MQRDFLVHTMSSDTLTELQHQADALRENIKEVDETLKKLTGRDPSENRRSLINRRVPLKRNAFASETQGPEAKRQVVAGERRRWGRPALASVAEGSRRLSTIEVGSGGEEDDESKPAVPSSVVATGAPIVFQVEEMPRVEEKDAVVRNRNRRMFGLLMGTLKQFKKESQTKTELEKRREEMVQKVEEQVIKDRQEAANERRQLYQTRRDKQQELKQLELKMEIAELKLELKEHYDKFNSFIQLKSTPRVFYVPAVHNRKTLQLLELSRKDMEASFKLRVRELDISVDEPQRVVEHVDRRGQGKSEKDPIILDPLPTRDLFAEDADDDRRDREAKKDPGRVRAGDEQGKTLGGGPQESGRSASSFRKPAGGESKAFVGDVGVDDGARSGEGEVVVQAGAAEQALDQDTAKFDFQDDYNVFDESARAKVDYNHVAEGKNVQTDKTCANNNTSAGSDFDNRISSRFLDSNISNLPSSSDLSIGHRRDGRVSPEVNMEFEPAVDDHMDMVDSIRDEMLEG